MHWDSMKGTWNPMRYLWCGLAGATLANSCSLAIPVCTAVQMNVSWLRKRGKACILA